MDGSVAQEGRTCNNTHGLPLPEISGKAYVVAILAAETPLARVYQMENMRRVFFCRSDTSGILAEDYIFYFLRQLEPDFFGYLFIFDNVYGNIWIYKTEEIKIDTDCIVDLDNVLAAHVA